MACEVLQSEWLGGQLPAAQGGGIESVRSFFCQRRFAECLSECVSVYPTAGASDRTLVLSVAVQSLFELGQVAKAQCLLPAVYAKDLQSMPVSLVVLQAKLTAVTDPDSASEFCGSFLSAVADRPAQSDDMDVLEVLVEEALLRTCEPAAVSELLETDATFLKVSSVDAERYGALKRSVAAAVAAAERAQRAAAERKEAQRRAESAAAQTQRAASPPPSAPPASDELVTPSPGTPEQRALPPTPVRAAPREPARASKKQPDVLSALRDVWRRVVSGQMTVRELAVLVLPVMLLIVLVRRRPQEVITL